MSIDSINNYGTTGTNNTSNAAGSKGQGTLSMDDFLQLLVAQLKNQDMYNSMDDSEYMAQMAQFSMLQAITDMNELSMTSYGVSLIGKEVTIANVADDGTVSSFKGIVDSVNFYNGSPQVVVDDRSYSLSSVMSVNEPKIIIPNGEVLNNNASQETVGTGSTNTDSTDSTDTDNTGSVDTDSTGSTNTDGAGSGE